MTAKTTSRSARAWLECQLSDGQEHRMDDLLISGMMAGYAEQTLRQAARTLRIARRYAQDDVARHGALVERWQLPPRQP
jgi:hypothetical protein